MKSFFFIMTLSLILISCKEEPILEQKNLYDTTLTIDWMQDLQLKYPDKEITLKDICLPRAHDAGVYVLNNCNAGNACNTKTQYLDMRLMLESGIRVFDLRPSLVNGEYWTFHRTSCGGLGCEGVELRTFLEDTKAFLDQHNELVIFEITHLCNTGSQDPGLIALFDDVLGNTKYTLNGSLPGFFINEPLSNIIPPNQTSGKVLLLWEDVGTSAQNTSTGLFANNFIASAGTYANSPIIDDVINDQLQKFMNYNPVSNTVFEFNYTFTLNVGLALSCFSDSTNARSIEDIALEGRGRLITTLDDWIANGYITSDKIPNILSIDFANTAVTEQCIRLSELSLQ